jgi:hypothetical protein
MGYNHWLQRMSSYRISRLLTLVSAGVLMSGFVAYKGGLLSASGSRKLNPRPVYRVAGKEQVDTPPPVAPVIKTTWISSTKQISIYEPEPNDLYMYSSKSGVISNFRLFPFKAETRLLSGLRLNIHSIFHRAIVRARLKYHELHRGNKEAFIPDSSVYPLLFEP